MANEMLTEIDVVREGEYAKHGEVKVVLTEAQAAKLAELLSICVDRDTITSDWNEPETMTFVDELVVKLHP